MYMPNKSQICTHPTDESDDRTQQGSDVQSPSVDTFSESISSSVDAGHDESASATSLNSSGRSLPVTSHFKPEGAPVTPSAGLTSKQKVQWEQQPASADAVSSTPKICRSLPPSLPSSHGLFQAQHGYSSGSPQKPFPRRSNQMKNFSSPQGLQGMHRRHSVASQPWTLRTPTMQHSPHHTNTSSMTGVPEPLAVQELAFRQGQHDSASSRDRIPTSPFAQRFDMMWAESYKRGKMFGSKPCSNLPAVEPSHQNYTWAVLINPYTQNFEHPNGFVDTRWVRKMCEIALNCMEALVRIVHERRPEWQKLVCDVPLPVQQALPSFPDLFERYKTLKRNASDAKAGGRPHRF